MLVRRAQRFLLLAKLFEAIRSAIESLGRFLNRLRRPVSRY